MSCNNDDDTYENDIIFLKEACVNVHKQEIFQRMKKTYNHRRNITDGIFETSRFKDTPGLVKNDLLIANIF